MLEEVRLVEEVGFFMCAGKCGGAAGRCVVNDTTI